MRPLLELLRLKPGQVTTPEEDVVTKKFETTFTATMKYLRHNQIEVDGMLLMEILAVAITEHEIVEGDKVETPKIILQ